MFFICANLLIPQLATDAKQEEMILEKLRAINELL